MNYEQIVSVPGRFFKKESNKGGFDIFYRSFKHRVSLFYCWTNSEDRASDMVGRMNSDILGSVVTFSEGVEKKLERTAEIISINKKRNINGFSSVSRDTN